MARSIAATTLTPADVIYVLQSSEDNSTLAEKYNVTRQAISSIRNGRTWKDVAPEIPRIPVRIKNTVPKARLVAAKHCHNCIEYQRSECSYGFPEAIDEPEFAAACSLYKRNPDHSQAMP
jgi:hypothetical protein